MLRLKQAHSDSNSRLRDLNASSESTYCDERDCDRKKLIFRPLHTRKTSSIPAMVLMLFVAGSINRSWSNRHADCEHCRRCYANSMKTIAAVLVLGLVYTGVGVAAESSKAVDPLQKSRADNRRLVTRIRELERQIRALTDQLAATQRELLATKSKLEASKVTVGTTAADGLIEGGPEEGGNFTYSNFSWGGDHRHLKMLGELKNNTGHDWRWVHIQVAIYDASGHLLATETIAVDYLLTGATKAFSEENFDLPDNRDYRFKFSFDGAALAE